jgi:Flp pilus assembly protein TadB
MKLLFQTLALCLFFALMGHTFSLQAAISETAPNTSPKVSISDLQKDKMVVKLEQKIERKIQKQQAQLADDDKKPVPTLSILSFVLGLTGLVLLFTGQAWYSALFGLSILLGLTGMILGYIVLGRHKRDNAKGKGLTIIGIILGKLTVLLAMAVFAFIAAMFGCC